MLQVENRVLPEKPGVPYLEAEPASAPAVDRLQALIGAQPQVETVLTHQFTPGLYIRTLWMPKGCLMVTKIHKTEHPFVLLSGRTSVWEERTGVLHLSAPHQGVTLPGTRRVFLTHEDCVLTTYHPTNETDPEKIVEEITVPRPLEDLTRVVKSLLEASC